MDPELLALLFADFELQSREGHRPRFNPLLLLGKKHTGAATAFYFGLHYDLPIPVTTISTVEQFVDYYSAGVLASELIALGGQSDDITIHKDVPRPRRRD